MFRRCRPLLCATAIGGPSELSTLPAVPNALDAPRRRTTLSLRTSSTVDACKFRSFEHPFFLPTVTADLPVNSLLVSRKRDLPTRRGFMAARSCLLDCLGVSLSAHSTELPPKRQTKLPFSPDLSPNQVHWGADSERIVLQPRFFSNPQEVDD